jgi:hypothetical protein
MMQARNKIAAGLIVAIFFLGGCASSGNEGRIQSYPAPETEAKWIREGEPIIYDGKRWYPQDDVEVLTDPEMALIGDYRGVQVFVAKSDVKPFQRLYTKFDINKYRYYYSKKKNDQSK